MNVDLASREECLNAEYVNNHATLSAALDVTLDDLLVLEGCVNALPALAETCLLVREYELTLLVLLVLNVNFYLVAYLELRVVTDSEAGMIPSLL